MKKLLLALAALVLVGTAWAGSVAYDAILIAPGPDAKEASFTVAPGESVHVIAQHLSDAGLVNGPRAFELFVKLTGVGPSIKAGTFLLREGMSYAAISATLAVSTKGTEVQVTIPEGYTAAQIGEAVRAAIPGITKAQWDASSKGLEGHLFPDTYRFRPDATADAVTAVMTATLARRLTENGIVPDKEFEKTLVLASIIEREVRDPKDMAMVSDIFHKRLKAGMALQADSTVNYAVGGNSPSVTYKDLEVDSPYNTYKYPGLPPGPISNPGMAAILAALHPEPNPYYYFLTTPSGEVKYARTFEEHLENRRRYLR